MPDPLTVLLIFIGVCGVLAYVAAIVYLLNYFGPYQVAMQILGFALIAALVTAELVFIPWGLEHWTR